MKKRMLSLMLALLMVIGMLPLSVISASAAESSIYVGGIKLSDKSYLVNGATKAQTTKPSSTGYAYYSSGELHLYGYRYTGAGIYGEGGSSTCAGILSKGTLKIVLHGNSTIDMDDTDSSLAIHTLSTLTIIAADGDTNASLKLKNCTDGIDAGGTVNINSGSVDITSQEYGIYAEGSFGMTKGRLSVWTDSDDGIYVGNIVLITGGNINIVSHGNGINAGVSYGQIGGNVTVYSNSIGISASSTTAATAVLVNGGSLNVNGVTHAIYSGSAIKFTKCAVELQSVDGAALYSRNSSITFENLTTLASGGLNDPMGPYSFAKNSSYRYIKAYDISNAEVIVGGVGMIGGMYLSADTMLLSKNKPSGGYAYYADGVLTLNNFSYQGEGHVLTSGSNRIANGIYSTTDLTIKLFGSNVLDIRMGSGNGHSNGIEAQGSLTIIRHDDTNYGSLTISNSSYGISHKGLAVTGVDITLRDADMTGIFGNNGSFFMGFGNLTITDSTSGIYGSVYMVGGNVDIRTTGYGIYGCETFAITGGNLAITNDSYGIDCTKKFNVNGGNLTINTTGECGVCCTDGVDANIENGTVSISADGYAVYASSINIENGNVTLISNNVKKDDSYGAMGTETGKVTFGDGLTVQVSKNADGSAPEAFALKDYFKYDYVYVTNQVSKVAFNLSGYRAGNRMTDLVLTGPDSVATYSGYLNVSKFVEGTSYDFEVLLTWKDGISFNGDPGKDITLDGLLPKTVEKKSSGDGYVLTYALPACSGQSVSEVGVFGLDAPVPGAHPDFTANVSNPYAYKFSRYGEDGCGFYWFDSEGVPLSATDIFEAGKTYSLEIKLEPNMDNGVYSFATPVTGKLNGKTAEVMANSKNAYITYTFQCGYDLYVGGVGMLNGDYLANGAKVTQISKPSGGYARYLDGVLYLHDYQYTGAVAIPELGNSDYYGIHSTGSLEIVLNGSNLIDLQKKSNSNGIYAQYQLKISAAPGQEGATLTVRNCIQGIHGGNTMICGGKIKVNSSLNGVDCGGVFNQTGGILEVTSSGSNGIYSAGLVYIQGGNLQINAGTIGIHTTNGYVQSNGKVHITADDTGIKANAVLVEGGDLFIMALNTAISSTNKIEFTNCTADLNGASRFALDSGNDTIIFRDVTASAAENLDTPMGQYIPANNDKYKIVLVGHGNGDVDTGTVTVNCIGSITHTVSGQTVTVTSNVPCKVGYLSGGSYVAISPIKNANGSYSFTAPAGVTQVVLVLKGDVSCDGRINVGDTAKTYSHVKGAAKLTDPIAIFAADVTGDAKINVGDTAKIYSHVKGSSPLAW